MRFTRIVHMIRPEPFMLPGAPPGLLLKMALDPEPSTAAELLHRDELSIELLEALVTQHTSLRESASQHPSAPLAWIETVPIGLLPGYTVESYLDRAGVNGDEREAILEAHSAGPSMGGPTLAEVRRRWSSMSNEPPR